MAKKETLDHGDFFKYFFVLLLAVVAFVAFLVVKPFMSAILASIVIAFIFYPVYTWMHKRIKSKNLCSLIVAIFIVLLISTPIIFLLQTSATEARYMYIRAKQKILTGELIDVNCFGREDTAVCKLNFAIREFVDDPDIQFYLKDIVGKMSGSVIERTGSFIIGLPGFILQILVTFFIIFYLFKDGPELVQRCKHLLPIKKVHQDHIYEKLKNTAHAVVYGSIVVALIQGALGALGFWIFGIKSWIFWGLIMAIFALVPFVGTAIIWIPAGLLLIATGSTEANTAMVGNGIGLLIYGALVISSIDNILKPKLIGDRAGIHPVLVLLGVLGGLMLFGFAGFIIGPIVLAVFKSFIDIYDKEKESHERR